MNFDGNIDFFSKELQGSIFVFSFKVEIGDKQQDEEELPDISDLGLLKKLNQNTKSPRFGMNNRNDAGSFSNLSDFHLEQYNSSL